MVPLLHSIKIFLEKKPIFILFLLAHFEILACGQKFVYGCSCINNRNDFNNALSYTEEFNPYTYRNFYNGGGVALGDINNDGLIDIFSRGIVENKLCLNLGNFNFKDITNEAGVACADVWSAGATFVDINHDGYLDLCM